MRLHVTISKTRDGEHDYIQIISDDALTVNVVLVADEVKVQDARDSAVLAAVKRIGRGEGEKWGYDTTTGEEGKP